MLNTNIKALDTNTSDIPALAIKALNPEISEPVDSYLMVDQTWKKDICNFYCMLYYQGRIAYSVEGAVSVDTNLTIFQLETNFRFELKVMAPNGDTIELKEPSYTYTEVANFK